VGWKTAQPFSTCAAEPLVDKRFARYPPYPSGSQLTKRMPIAATARSPRSLKARLTKTGASMLRIPVTAPIARAAH